MQILEVKPLLLNVADVRLRVTPEEFDRLCRLNPDLRLEINRDGELIVMPPTGGDTGKRNFKLIVQFGNWVEKNGLGEGFDSSTGYNFTAVGGKNPSPDVSWIEKSRLEGVDTSGLIPVVPDFVIELRSKSDPLKEVRAKMEEYRRVGVRLGWLVNPQDKTVEIYRPERDVEILEDPETLNGEDVLLGFTLDLRSIF
ncbi:Uma2 family endonuclease [Chamaesiphon sp. VAR_69_metabat_338]|uniref:Uma2 family endonuclease n=1 Tax=Chamaesiphon sp. VAR_69_metabat_338 TaxID=2964704 RepID=UPI00286E9207|nr:Uma2 family endonuclease [Chamaesiphon sp. VAR_69_metabat_338]